MTKFFLKNLKRTNFGAILGPFYPNLGKNGFSWKKELCQFLEEENTKLIDRQTGDGDFTRPSVANFWGLSV